MRKLNSEIVLNWNSISHQVWSNIEKDNAENNQVDKLQVDFDITPKTELDDLALGKQVHSL